MYWIHDQLYVSDRSILEKSRNIKEWNNATVIFNRIIKEEENLKTYVLLCAEQYRMPIAYCSTVHGS